MIKEIEIYKAIGEETRLRILRIMIKAGIEICACEIMDVLDKPQYTVSKSLSILVTAGLIEERREGRMMLYKLIYDDFNKIIFKNIELIKDTSNPCFKDDFIQLENRLSLRKNGKCVVTLKR